MGARSGLPLEKADETTDIGICAEQGKGKVSGTKTLVVVSPGSGPVYLLIGLQDGPQFTYKYVAAKPAAPVPASLTTKQIQRALSWLGLYTGPLDGRGSARLTVAIKDFQQKVGIRVDGKCGAQCRAALAEARALDDPAVRADQPPITVRTVKELQSDLAKLGYYTGSLDGRNGETLVQAVKRFQHSAQITVDGTCERRCQLALVKALTRG